MTKTKPGKPAQTVLSGLCPRCGETVATPAPITRCSCGQHVRNRLDGFSSKPFLMPRRAPNKTTQAAAEQVANCTEPHCHHAGTCLLTPCVSPTHQATQAAAE